MQPLGLVELLDWTSAALDRVDRAAFFDRFDAGEAVPYFYEPFLEAFDPELRKQLGVWYTPAEVVRYMVARVDMALKEDLGIADGLAADNVFVLDPCCGTGTYLAEVLRRIAANLQGKGLGALTGAQVKRAATQRVFGFEIMPAPFVVSHLQVGLTMQALDAPLSDDETERAGVYLTNALTGWEPSVQKPLPFPELEEERDRADRVKQDTPVLVILGNPPYNGFAGMAVDEERELSAAYRTTRRVRRPEGQGLNDLYVRFFRMAERRIAEKTGRGVVCFISNYSWLDGLSFTGMRERYLEAFDVIRIDSLNGDKYKTGKTTPDGAPDPSIFSTPGDPVGIQVGTAITTLVRKADHQPAKEVGFRHLWGQTKLSDLTATAEAGSDTLYDNVEPSLPLGLPFTPIAVSGGWSAWPALPELFPVSFPGVQSKRDAFLIDIELNKLKARVGEYFDPSVSSNEVATKYPSAMKSSSGFVVSDAQKVRNSLLARGGPIDDNFVRHAYRPFDTRWLYWEAGHGLLGRPVPDYKPHLFENNLWMVAQHKPRREWSPPQAISSLGCLDLIDRGATCIPAWLHEEGMALDGGGEQRRPNLSDAAQRYLDRLGLGVEDLFHHALAVLHNPSYREDNAGALRMEWPRIPLPGWPDGDAPGAAEEVATSAARGRELAALLDSETPVPGVTTGALRTEMAAIAVPSTTDGGNMAGDDFSVTASWGHFGQGEAVMPGHGRVVERSYTAEERAALGESAHLSARPPSTSTSTTAPTGATSRRRSGATSWAGTRSSRSGSPTASAASWIGLCCQRRCSTSRTPPGASRGYWGWLGRGEGLLKSSFFWFAFAAFMVLVLGPVIALWRWDWLSDGGSETASNGETLRNAGLLIGGALAQFVFAGWRAWVAERQAGTAKDQADTARVQADTAKLQADTAERQSTTALWSLLNERYEQGASRLGSDDLTVRMEGMDMLERLARDHPQEYHVQVMKRLSLFVRTSHVPQRFPGEVRAAMAAIGSRSKEDIEHLKTTRLSS